jgi:hypothetical protein
MAKMSDAEMRTRLAAILEEYEARGGNGDGDSHSVKAQIWQAQQLRYLAIEARQSGWSDEEMGEVRVRHYQSTKQI